jgi:hypothetical protein
MNVLASSRLSARAGPAALPAAPVAGVAARRGSRCSAASPTCFQSSRGAAAPRRPIAAAAATGSAAEAPATTTSSSSSGGDRSHETEVVIIGSGIGGLCCGALLAKYGVKVSYKYRDLLAFARRLA